VCSIKAEGAASQAAGGCQGGEVCGIKAEGAASEAAGGCQGGALILFIQTLALCKSFTYLLTYLLTYRVNKQLRSLTVADDAHLLDSDMLAP